MVEEDIRVLREDMEQVKKDLAEIKSILQSAIKNRKGRRKPLAPWV